MTCTCAGSLGLLLVLLCGVGIAWATGAAAAGRTAARRRRAALAGVRRARSWSTIGFLAALDRPGRSAPGQRVHQGVDLALAQAVLRGHRGDRVPAGRRRRPRARRPPRAGRRRPGARPAAGGAPPTTRVISPRGSPLAGPVGQLAERRRGGPPRTSWSARGTPRPAGPRRTRRPGRRAWRRSGAAPRRRPACAARRRARAAGRGGSPPARGRKPSKQNRSLGSPDSASAVVTALGPGRGGDRHAGVERRPDQPVAGVGDARHAAVGDQRDHARRRAGPSTSSGVRRSSLPSK